MKIDRYFFKELFWATIGYVVASSILYALISYFEPFTAAVLSLGLFLSMLAIKEIFK